MMWVMAICLGMCGLICGYVIGASKGVEKKKPAWYDWGKMDGEAEGYKKGYDEGFKAGNEGGLTEDEKESIKQVLAVLTFGSERRNED